MRERYRQAKKYLLAKSRDALAEVYRLKWAIGISIGTMLLLDAYGINPMNRWALLAHKFSTITLAVIAAHLIRREIFPYLDLSVALESRDRGYAIGSALIVSILMAAIILGVALGL